MHPAPDKSPYVLIADDEPIIADTLRMILKVKGFPAVSFYCGKEALRYAEGHPPRMLISDVVMPDITGFDLAISLKNKFPDCAVLLISGQVATALLLEQARNAGYEFEVLAKPVPPQEILQRVARVFGLPG